MTVEVLHCDNHLLAVVKPACLPCVPDASEDESLLDRARAWVEREFEKPGRAFLGVVQRLDRPVSGVLVLARTSKAAERLTRAFAERRVAKTYWGVVHGAPREDEGELEQWLLKDRARNYVAVVGPKTRGARCAITRWRVLRREGERAWLELLPATGRPHQLRLACRALGAPLLGDVKYDAPFALPDKSVALHARALELEHPTRGERLRFEAAPPAQEWWTLAGA